MKMNKDDNGYKLTVLGKVPKEWKVVKFEDAVQIHVGKDLKLNWFSEKRSNEYCYPVYSNTVENNGLYGYYNKHEYSGDSFTIVGRGVGLGTAFYKSGGYGAIGRLLVLFPKDRTDAQFLTYYTNFKVRFFTESSGIPQLTGLQLASYSIALPPLFEQKKIAQILSIWDKAIGKTEQLIQCKNQLKKGMMQQLLTRKRSFKEFEREEWINIELGKIGFFKTSSVDKKFVPGEKVVKLVNYMDVYRNKFISSELVLSTTSVKDREIETNGLVKGDILFTPSSETPDDIGHSAVVTEDLPETVYSYHLVRFRPKDDNTLEYNFRGYVFNNSLILKEFSTKATGSTRFTLSKKDFEETKAFIPRSPKEQLKIASVLLKLDQEIDTIQKQHKLLIKQKKGLMQKLLTGEVRVKIEF